MDDEAKIPLRFLLGVKQADQPNRIVVWDTEEVTVGRMPDNDIVVDDDEASRNHALFRRSPSGHFVRDLGTANGTLVNDEPLTSDRALEIRDTITIGATKLTFISTRKDPAASGMEVVYASQLKGFEGTSGDAPPDATMMSLGDLENEPEFTVDAVGSYGIDAAAPATRDLDLEMSQETVSLHLEIDGLTPDLRRLVSNLLDKTLELPSLRIRIKGDDGG